MIVTGFHCVGPIGPIQVGYPHLLMGWHGDNELSAGLLGVHFGVGEGFAPFPLLAYLSSSPEHLKLEAGAHL